MMGEIFMPKMGDAMTEGKVVRWYMKQGDPLKKGDPVLEIETDKVNLDLEAEEDGFLGEIKVPDGEVAQVGQTLAMIDADASSPSKASKTPKATPKSKSDAAAAEEPEAKPAAKKKAAPAGEDEEEPDGEAPEKDKPKDKEKEPEPAGGEGEEPAIEEPPADRQRLRLVPEEKGQEQNGSPGSLRSSPLARKMASEMGVDIASVRGSGPGGRIIAADIEQARKGASGGSPQVPAKATPQKRQMPPSAKLATREIPLTAMRRTIARRLAESIGPIPHFYLTVDLDVTALGSLRAQLNDIEGIKTSLNDFVIRATALALHHHPYVNASFAGESIKQHGEIHVGVAVATPEGLITPVIRNADMKSVSEIAAEVRQLAQKARSRKLKPDEYQGGTITISNLGMYGIEEFTAIINPPNSAILALGAATSQPVVVNGKVVIRERMKVTMSCDHRVIDGASGAEFLQTFRQYIEQPLRLVM